MIIVCPHCGGLNRVEDQRLTQHPTCGKCKNALFTGQPVEMTGDQFMRALNKSDQPLVVDFWAPWCGPCKLFAPTFSKAAMTWEPQARFVKINTENEQAVAAQFGIRSIPTLAIFKNGKELARQSGAMQTGQFDQWIQSVL